MKICIVTNYRRTTNYGAILQAYALNRFIRNQGYECETLSYAPLKDKKEFIHNNLKNPKRIIGAIFNRCIKYPIKSRLRKRAEIFELFRYENIPHTEDCNQYTAAEKVKEYDVLICGSDQIWRPGLFSGKFDDVMWLKIFDENKRKISYAASIGLAKLTPSMNEYIKQSLKSFEAVSVREDSAVELMKPLFNNGDVKKTVDPVMLLERDEWNAFADASQLNHRKKYLFAYFIQPDSVVYKKAEAFAREKSMEFVYFPYMSNKFSFTETFCSGEKIYDASPCDFVKYIRDAEYVITDSFHATVFSLIFEKNFYVFATNHTTRLVSLLDMCDMQERCISKNDNMCCTTITDEKWSACRKNLAEKKQESISFLLGAIKGEQK